MKKRISILLVMMMIFSMTSSFVFAEDLVAAGDPAEGAPLLDETTPEETPEEVTEPLAEGEENNETPEEGKAKIAGNVTINMPVDADLVDRKNDVKVVWDTDNTLTITKSQIEVKKDGAAYGETVNVENADKDYTFNGLPAGEYSFTVTSFNGYDEVGKGAKTITVPEMPEAITSFETFSAYKSVVLEWNKPSEGKKPTRYEIWSDGAKIADVANPASPYDRGTVYYYQCTNAKDEKVHSYTVKAVNVAGGKEVSVASAEKPDQMLMPMYVQCTFKQTKTLKAHDKSKAKRKFRKGETIKAFTFVKGQYRFYDDKGHLYYCNYNRLKNKKALYNGYKNWNYSDREAEYFINTAGQTSMTNYMLFVNLYTQHLYILSGKKNTKGRWKVITLNYKGKAYRDWEVASGKATSPTPCGLELKYGKKLVNIYKKSGTVYGHKTKNWNFYHSQTALHGRVGKNIYGKPRSLGCIRNTDAQAIFIKKCIPMKTRVAVY